MGGRKLQGTPVNESFVLFEDSWYVLLTSKGKFAETGDMELAEALQKRHSDSWIQIQKNPDRRGTKK